MRLWSESRNYSANTSGRTSIASWVKSVKPAPGFPFNRKDTFTVPGMGAKCLMHKPWPKCRTCYRPMLLNREAAHLEDIVTANLRAFVCEKCPTEPAQSPPTVTPLHPE
jgi:hypothetical protein